MRDPQRTKTKKKYLEVKELFENISNKTTNKSILIYNDSQFYKIFFQLMESVRNHDLLFSHQRDVGGTVCPTADSTST